MTESKITIRMDQVLKNEIEKIARQHGLTISDLIREAVLFYIKHVLGEKSNILEDYERRLMETKVQMFMREAREYIVDAHRKCKEGAGFNGNNKYTLRLIEEGTKLLKQVQDPALRGEIKRVLDELYKILTLECKPIIPMY